MQTGAEVQIQACISLRAVHPLAVRREHPISVARAYLEPCDTSPRGPRPQPPSAYPLHYCPVPQGYRRDFCHNRSTPLATAVHALPHRPLTARPPDIIRLHHPFVISAIPSSPSTFRYAPSAFSPVRAHPHGPLYPLSRLLHSFPTRRLVSLISTIPLPTYPPSHLPLVTLLSPRLRRASLFPLVRESSASLYGDQPPSSPQHSYGCLLAADSSLAPDVRVLFRGH